MEGTIFTKAEHGFSFIDIYDNEHLTEVLSELPKDDIVHAYGSDSCTNVDRVENECNYDLAYFDKDGIHIAVLNASGADAKKLYAHCDGVVAFPVADKICLQTSTGGKHD